jgi:hypothetical protein
MKLKRTNEKLFQSYLKRFSAKAIDIFQNKINQCILTMPFEIEEAGHFSNNRIKWLNVVVIPVTDIKKVIALKEYTRCFLKRQTAEALKSRSKLKLLLILNY